MPDSTTIDRLWDEFTDALGAAGESERDLAALRDRFLGRRSGAVTALFQQLGALPPEERRAFGQRLNELKARVEAALAERLERAASARPPAGAVDVTLPGRHVPAGHRHPLAVRARAHRGHLRAHGLRDPRRPETEDDWHNFEALNMPPEHPARDMQDTLYLGAPLERRLAHRGGPPAARGARPGHAPAHAHLGDADPLHGAASPPVRVIAPGRVYRRDNLDLTHTPMFQQVEGLVVGEGVTMADLKGTIIGCLRELFGAETPASCSARASSPTPSRAPTCSSPAAVRRQRVPRVQAHRLARGARLRHGAPAVFEAVGYDPERSRASPSASASSASPC
jgi:phenylalanyl-tRNA synthetase alpha chain